MQYLRVFVQDALDFWDEALRVVCPHSNDVDVVPRELYVGAGEESGDLGLMKCVDDELDHMAVVGCRGRDEQRDEEREHVHMVVHVR